MERVIENLKSVVLVVLLFSTMLLLYFFWENPSWSAFRISDIITNEDAPVVVITAKEVTKPIETVVHFGNDVYNVLEYNKYGMFDETLLTLSRFASDEDLAVEEITKEQHNQVMKFPSLKFNYNYEIPFSSFCAEYGISTGQSLDSIPFLTGISYSTGSPESLFIYDGKNNKWFRLLAKEEEIPLAEYIERIEKSGYLPYYTIGTLGGTENPTVLPLALESKQEEIAYQKEFAVEEQDALKAFAQTFFGESFDFVRRIEESKGAIIYMYGYGERILTINPDGSILYKEKESDSASPQQDYFTALSKALQFIAAHGGFETDEGISPTPYVVDVSAIEKERRRGYRFTFGGELRGIPVSLDTSELMEIEIFGDQVTYYSRNLIRVDEINLFEGTEANSREAFSAINMIAQNYILIGQELQKQNTSDVALSEEITFESVSDRIRSIKAGFAAVENDGNEKTLIPAWIVDTADACLFFDLYTARPLGRYDRER